MTTEDLDRRMAELEDRMSRIERLLGGRETSARITGAEDVSTGDVLTTPRGAIRPEEEIEFELGQNWFAKLGIVVLAFGIVFLLTLPYAGLPPAVPGLLGYLLAGGLFLMARLMMRSFDLVSRYLRGAGMILLFFTTLRLFYFGPQPVMEAGSVTGSGLLMAVLAVNFAVALRRKSQYLFGLALVTAYATAIAVGSAWLVFTVITVLSLLTVVARLRYGWSGILIFSTFFAYLTHLVWAINNPFLGNSIGFVQGPMMGIFFLLVYAAIFAFGTILRADREQEGFNVIAASFLNGGGSYGLFLLHSSLAFQGTLLPTHLFAAVFFLGLATVFWVREKSLFSTFAYVMLGYLALSVAIIVSFQVPNLFVWISVQSLIVVATAIWFRSRFIVVANFVIYLAVMIGYLAVGGEETGISIGFGIVALASARILNWQKDRLELKTEMMRNAYLVAALGVFPYATYHLVPGEYISLSWVGIAGFYYLMNLIVKAQKYRWMGHLTLLLTVLYVVIIGTASLEATYRIISFLVLGTVLLIGSLIFTRLRARRREEETGAVKTDEIPSGS